jgi:NAD(P)-dependent dehydrogenase (short-subunit alcohol dehydrogenase family)
MQGMMPDFDLSGRVALVTGSSKGLGRAMATALGRAGAKVAFNYQNDRASAERAFEEYRAEGLEGGLFRANVVDADEVRHLCRDRARTDRHRGGERDARAAPQGDRAL